MNRTPSTDAARIMPRFTRRDRWKTLVLTCALLVLHRPLVAQEASESTQQLNDDTTLLDGLRDRRLFDIAEDYCREQLSQPTVDPTGQSTLVVELMKTQTTRAILSNLADRESAWRAIDMTAAEFERTFPDHPRKFLVQIQHALSHLAHSQLLRQELDADMATDSTRVEALEQVNLARSLLGNLQREISGAIPDRNGRTLTEHELTSEQLLNLNNNVRYQLAVCDLNRARLYEPSDRLNRIDALNGVSQRLIEVQRSASDGQPLWWKSKLGQIECLRLLGTPTEARALAESLPRREAPPAIHDSLLEQEARCAIELGREDYSQSILTEFNAFNGRTAQLELAVIELAVDLATRARTENRKREWITFAADLSKSIEQAHGRYWGRRADLILIGATGVADSGTGANETSKATNPVTSPASASNNVELNLLMRLAEEANRKELWDDALKAYDRAATLALSLNQTDQALRMDFQAGKILEKQGQHRLAAQRLTSSAVRDDRLLFAPSVHLVGCWNFAKAIQSDQPEQRKRFEELLQDHLQRWPSGTAANQARVWLAGEYQSGRQWQKAFDLYLLVDNNSPHSGKAAEQAIDCANRALLVQQQTGGSTESLAHHLIEQLSQKRRSLQKTNSLSFRLELTQAELDLTFGSRKPDPSLANSLIPIESAADGTLANMARAIHAVSLSVAQPEQAKQLLAQIAGDEPALGLCERCLAAIVENPSAGESLTSIHELRLAAIESALATPAMQQQENEAARTNWMLKQAAALNSLDRQSESIPVLKLLEKRHPRNAGVQMQLARAMSIQYGKTDPQIPLDQWRRVAARLKSHSPHWFEAKYEVARLLVESGDAASATKLLKYIQAIPPGWDQSSLKPEFEKLLRRSEENK